MSCIDKKPQESCGGLLHSRCRRPSPCSWAHSSNTLVREHILVAASYAAVAGAPLLVRGHTLVREHILVAASYAAVPLLVRGLDQKLAGDDVVCV